MPKMTFFDPEKPDEWIDEQVKLADQYLEKQKAEAEAEAEKGLKQIPNDKQKRKDVRGKLLKLPKLPKLPQAPSIRSCPYR
jgi:hypothetical protein